MAGIPLGEWSGSDATNALNAAIERFQTRAEEQTKTMIRLTRAIVALTVPFGCRRTTRQQPAGLIPQSGVPAKHGACGRTGIRR